MRRQMGWLWWLVASVAVADVVAPDFSDRSYRALTLDNQLKVLLISDPTSDRAAASMDVAVGSAIQGDDEHYTYEPADAPSFAVVCDPKSLLYIYGMQLDFSSALIGGGFNFTNPNASQTCGCGSSFAV